VSVADHGHVHVLDRADAFAPDAAAASGDSDVLSPMPGTVLTVRVATGELVEAGQPLGVLEAMKMEVTLRAPFAGTVTSVGAGAGEQVPLGAVLFRVEPPPPAGPDAAADELSP
jgi:biotin carboxyl carrier protein